MSEKSPSHFKNTSPMGSVIGKSEAETVARNIMVILSRTGDVFRPLSWDEYKTERMKDGNFSEKERRYFDQVIGYCKSADTAVLFCPGWAEVANKD